MPSVAGHHDFAVLEARLAELIRELKARDPAGPFAPVAVLVPNDDLRDHVQIALARSLGALLGVDVTTHEVFAREAARGAGAVIPRRLSPRVREAIAAEAIESAGGGLAAFVAARPGSAAAILQTLDELREAGIDAAAAPAVPGLTPRGRDLAKLHAEYAARLDPLLERGLADRAGALRAARPDVAEHARRYRLVVHYGAYELIGANLELLRAIDRSGTPLAVLLPWHPTSPAFEHARRSLPAALGATVTFLDAPAGAEARLLRERLPALYDQDASPGAIETAGAVEFFHAQGAAAELAEVALRILALHRDEGIPLSRIGVLARTLEPYAPLLRAGFGGRGVPFTTSATLGALREPHALAARNLVRAAFSDFERQPLMDLFRGGLWRPASPRRAALAGAAHGWEKLSRAWRATRGLRTFTQDLPRWLARWSAPVADDADEEMKAAAAELTARRREEAAALAAEVQSLADALAPAARAATWRDWSDQVEGALATCVAGFEDSSTPDDPPAGVGAVRGVLSELRDLDAVGAPFTAGSAAARFERSLREARAPIAGLAPEGVRVLDAVRARGLAFDAVFLIGLNGDLFPRRAREDPFLPDDDRRLLGETLRVPLSIRGAARDEEHLLLAHLLGSARRRLVVSWQRADAAGTARPLSLALREIARVALGAPDLEAAGRLATRVGAHPADAARDAATRFGLLSGREARLGAALSLPSAAHVRRALPLLPAAPRDAEGDGALEAGLRMLEAIDEAAPSRLEYDALAGPGAPPVAEWSPSRLETLGACPQQYFFRHILRVEEMDEIAEPYELDAREMGLAVHAVLADVYGRLFGAPDALREGLDPARAASRALELLREAWAARTADIAERMHGRYPLLWSETSRLYRNALETFVLFDAPSLARDRGALLGVESPVRGTIAPDSGSPAIAVRGRIDRVTRDGAGGIVVADFKTGRDLEGHVAMRGLLKGRRLQMALYALLAEASRAGWGGGDRAIAVEVIGIGPEHAGGIEPPAEDEPRGYPARAALDPKKFLECREGILETIGVLAKLAASGFFPLDPASERCRYCPYARACRRSHAPTLARLRAAPPAADFYRLRGKSTRARTLADVKDAEGDET